MTVYFLGTISSIFLALISDEIKKKSKFDALTKKVLSKAFAFLSFLPLTIIMAVRYGVGTDFWGYWALYQTDSKDHEIGFVYFNRFLHLFSDDPQVFFIISSIIVCGSFFYAAYRWSVSPAFSILLFVVCKDYFIAMNGTRQYLAGAIALFSIPYIKNRQWVKTFILVLVAFLFHRSAIILFLLYILYHYLIPPTTVFLLVIGAYFFSSYLAQRIMAAFARFGFYMKYFVESSSYFNRNGDMGIAYILIFLSFFLLLAYEYKVVEKNENMRLMYTAIVLGLVVLAFGKIMPTNFHRVSWYMNAYIALFLPEATKAIRNQKIRWAVNVAVVCLYAAYTLTGISGKSGILYGNHDVLPYRSIFS